MAQNLAKPRWEKHVLNRCPVSGFLTSYPYCPACGKKTLPGIGTSQPDSVDHHRMVGCEGCADKQRSIDTLQGICAGYEARLKRFQTLARKRRATKRKAANVAISYDGETELPKQPKESK